ncbi:MAG: sensor histidine kinase [Eubacteriales bacterium]
MNNKDNNKLHLLMSLRMLMFFLGYGIALAGGYGVTKLIYQFTGEPPVILSYIFSGFASVFLVVLIARIVMHITGRYKFNHNIHENLMDALHQISQGNFDVILNPGQGFEHHELVTAINDMAKNLGTLETMRQDFISNVSHEIQSPLTSISGFAVLLKNADLPIEERLHYAEIIESESKRLSGLSENLMKLSSLDNNKTGLNRDFFRLDKQLESVALTLEPQWTGKNIELDVQFHKTSICGDEDLLSQVWINLIHNAIKFTPVGGKITMELFANSDNAIMKITDTGVGIAPNDKIHIFERFYKVDKSRDRSLGGNGLGLSLVKKIIELHDGNITVESEIGKCTTFTVTLPQK